MLDEILEMILEDALERMDKTIADFRGKLQGIRAGRATPMMLQDVKVNAYGKMMPLNHLASVTAPQPDLIIVQPWDRATFRSVERAIMSSDLGLNPSNDGALIRVPVPPLTEERRRALVRSARRLGEEAKIAIRNIRRHAKDDVKATQEEEKLSEDMRYLAEGRLQDETNSFVRKIDDILRVKEHAIMEI